MPERTMPAEIQHEIEKSYEEQLAELKAKLEQLTRDFARAEASGDKAAVNALAKKVDEVSAEIEDLELGQRKAA